MDADRQAFLLPTGSALALGRKITKKLNNARETVL